VSIYELYLLIWVIAAAQQLSEMKASAAFLAPFGFFVVLALGTSLAKALVGMAR